MTKESVITFVALELSYVLDLKQWFSTWVATRYTH